MKLPKFADLRAIADDLSGDPRFGKISKSIRKAALAQACASDLAQSMSCCDALAALHKSPRKQGSDERASIENSLLVNAVWLYSRATATVGKAGERGSINITAKLTPERLADHETLVELRNRSFAHVHTNEQIADVTWHRDLLFVVQTGNGWKPASVTQRISFHKPTLDRLRRQVPVAWSIMVEKFRWQMDEMCRLMNETPIGIAIMEKNAFDPVTFFGSEEAVRKGLDGIDIGWASGYSNR